MIDDVMSFSSPPMCQLKKRCREDVDDDEGEVGEEIVEEESKVLFACCTLCVLCTVEILHFLIRAHTHAYTDNIA